ncbi:MAG: PQQ-like beta-propeller repeat protein [Flavobacteriales bacterium]|nr:PQQ-like beta-propeller repeat protein [Flavobacteriales bacterium]
MKKIILLFSILLTKLALAEDTTKVIIGYDYMSKTNIYGDVRQMPKNFHNIFVDTINNNLYAHYKTNDLVVKSQVVCYDLITLKEKWSRLFEHQNIIFYHDKIFYFTYTKAYRINPNTGKDIWVKNQRIVIPNKKLDYGLTFNKSETSDGIHLAGVNLEDGNEIWYKEIPNAVITNDIYHQENDIILNISGLLKLNIKDGYKWHFEAENSLNSFSFSKIQNRYYGFYSNLEADSNHYYQAFLRFLVCLDKNGNTIWKSEIPEKNVTGYHLFSSNSSLYLIGLGRSNSHSLFVNDNIKINSPFIAEYDKTTGQNIFLIDTIPISKKEYIIDFIKVDSLIYLRTKNNLIQFNINSKTFKVKAQYNKRLFYKVKGFLPNNTFIEFDSNLVSSSKINQSGIVMIAYEDESEASTYAFNNWGKVKFYQIDEDLNVVKEIVNPKIFKEYFDNNDNNIQTLLYSNNELLQVNKDISIIKRFYFTSVPFHFKGSFYAFNQNNLIIGKSSDYTE